MLEYLYTMRIFLSGDIVEPGQYRDVESGDTVTLNEPDTLPERMRHVPVLRRFVRVDRQEEGVLKTGRTMPVTVLPSVNSPTGKFLMHRRNLRI